MTNKVCPSCGDTDVNEQMDGFREYTPPYGELTRSPIKSYKCNVCGASGDFYQENVEIESALIRSADSKSVLKMLSLLSEQGISNAYFERALDLPVRSVARWKNGQYTSSAISLLRMVTTYPWLLKVASLSFADDAAGNILVAAALDKVRELRAREKLNNPEAERIVAFMHVNQENSGEGECVFLGYAPLKKPRRSVTVSVSTIGVTNGDN